MKNTILILLFFFFSFSLGSAENQQNLTLENNSNVEKVTVLHRTGKGYVELVIPLKRLPSHLAHGDILPCDPNVPPGCE